MVDFSSANQNRLIFHTSLIGNLSATIVNGFQDVLIDVDQNGNGAADGQVLVQNLVADLGIDNLLGDPFFAEAALLNFLIFGPDGDGNENGIIDFLDKCIDEQPFVVDTPIVDCPEPVYISVPKIIPLDSKHLGDTIYNTTEADVAGLVLQPDEDVFLVEGAIAAERETSSPSEA